MFSRKMDDVRLFATVCFFVFYHVQLDVWMCDVRTGNGDNAAGCRFHNILPGCCGPTAAGIAMYSALRLLVFSIFIHTIISLYNEVVL